jgi:hypothetical protein
MFGIPALYKIGDSICVYLFGQWPESHAPHLQNA